MNKIRNKLKSYQYRYFNFRLLLWVYALSILGIMVIGSAAEGENYQQKQIIGLVFGSVVLLIVTLFDYKFVMKFYWLLYLINLGLLLWVKFGGEEVNGAKRWVNLGFTNLQPSEFMKIILIVFFAKLIFKFQEHINKLRFLVVLVMLLGIPLYLVLKQPNLSTSIVIAFLFCAIVYIAGISYKIILGVLAIAIPVMGVLLYLVLQPNQKIIEEYQYNRLIGFYMEDEDSEVAAKINYQQNNSILAIGSGGLMGKGLNNNTVSSVKNGNFISEPQTDFIYSIVGEELGFVGSLSVILLLALISFECFLVGRNAEDLAGRIIGCGMGSLIAFQSFVNIGVVTKLLPNTGLPLPFVSYGLSSLVSMLIGIGLVLNVSMQRRKNY